MLMKYLTIAIVSSVFFLSCGDTPTAPGDDLVGTWVLVSEADPNVVGGAMSFRADGTFRMSLEVKVSSGSIEPFEFTGSWTIVGGQLLAVIDEAQYQGNRQEYIVQVDRQVDRQDYTIQGDRLTIFYKDGSVGIWKRRK